MKSWRKVILCLWAIPVAALFFLFSLHAPIEKSLLQIFGGKGAEDASYLIYQSILNGLIYVVPLQLFGNLLPDGMSRAAVFIFPRAHSRIRWYAKELLTVVFLTLLYDVLLLGGLTGALIMSGAQFYSVKTLATILGSIFLSTCLHHLGCTVMANVMGLVFSSKDVVMCVTILALTGPAVMLFLKDLPILLRIYPAAHAAIWPHEIPLLQRLFKSYFEKAIPGFSVSISAVYNIAYILLFTIVGARIMRQRNLTI